MSRPRWFGRAAPKPEPCHRCAELRSAPWQDLILLWWPGWEPTERDGERIRAMALAEHAAAGHPE